VGDVLIWLSGASRKILAECPTERPKYVGLGGAILIAATMAGISLSFALVSAFEIQLGYVIAFAVLWGIAILMVDRLFVASMHRQRNPLIYIALVLPRLAMAVVLGAVISTPFVLQIFRPEINSEIQQMQAAQRAAYFKNLPENPVYLAVQQNQAQVNKLSALAASGGPGIDVSKDSQIAALNKQLDNAQAQLARYQRDLNCQLGKRSGDVTCQPGDGPVARYDQQQVTYYSGLGKTFSTEIANRTSTLNRQQAALQGSYQVKLKAAQQSLVSAQQRLTLQTADVTGGIRQNHGILEQLTALGKVTAGNSTLQWARALLFLLFLFIDILPVFMKLLINLLPASTYDKILAEEESMQVRVAEDYRAQQAAARRKAIQAEVTGLQYRNAAMAAELPGMKDDIIAMRQRIEREWLKRREAEMLSTLERGDITETGVPQAHAGQGEGLSAAYGDGSRDVRPWPPGWPAKPGFPAPQAGPAAAGADSRWAWARSLRQPVLRLRNQRAKLAPPPRGVQGPQPVPVRQPQAETPDQEDTEPDPVLSSVPADPDAFPAAVVTEKIYSQAMASHGSGQFSSESSGGGRSGAEPSYASGGDRRRYLQGRYPEIVSVGEPFGLVACIVLAPTSGAAMLRYFDVPQGGRDLRLEAYAPPGLRLLSHRLMTVHVPADGDSDPVMFELRADEPGVRTVSVIAWLDGSYLGELRVDITAEHGHSAGPYRDARAEISTEATEGAVSLIVRFDSRQNAYRFEFRDEDHPDEVTSNLAYEPGPRVEQLIASLDALAKGRSGHQADQVRAHLVNAGAALWHELVPKGLRDQFWERQSRIRQLTILADKDAVPWELLYPMDPGHDEGFLIEQFPVTRSIFGRRPTRKLSLWPARFVLPEDPLPWARAEIDAVRVSLDPSQPPHEVISGPRSLQNLIASGDFGLLHFACHSTYDPVYGSSIRLGNAPFTPTDIATAAINKVLARSSPTVFINACRSAGLSPTYNRLDGWATKFLEAGAAAFIGSLWAVSDGAAREFAQELYGKLQAGSSLGQAVKSARAAAASVPDDPTWLAYAVYGDPRATLGQARP